MKDIFFERRKHKDKRMAVTGEVPFYLLHQRDAVHAGHQVVGENEIERAIFVSESLFLVPYASFVERIFYRLVNHS